MLLFRPSIPSLIASSAADESPGPEGARVVQFALNLDGLGQSAVR
jgi:hypothetical protein